MKNETLINLRGKQSRAIVAESLGITPQGLGMIERGKRIPRPHLMKRIADYYNKTVDELFFDNKRHNLCQKRMLEPCCPTPSQLAVDETCATLDKVG